MNIFKLFDSNDINSIKLGVQVIKTLGLQNEFEKYFKNSFEEYLFILTDFKLNENNVRWLLQEQPQLKSYFNK